MRTRPKNIKEFQKLVERYETITLEEIKKDPNPRNLTGFGSGLACSLCKKVKRECHLCIYEDQNIIYWRGHLGELGCLKGKNQKTYEDIKCAVTPMKIFNAYKRRAKHLRESYSQYLK